jgi:hypothetical protein
MAKPKLKLDTAKIKEFFKTRQEIVGLATACVLAVVCFFWGVSKWLSASSPDAAILQDAKKIESGRANAAAYVPPEITKGPKDDKKKGGFSAWPLVTAADAPLTLGYPWFIPGFAGDPRRFSPRILVPDAIQMDHLAKGVFTYKANDASMWVFDLGPNPAVVEPVLQVIGKHMVVVSGTFPYNDQVEIFKKALRMEQADEVFSSGLAPSLTGLNVERRKITTQNGEQQPGPWEAIYMFDPASGGMKTNEANESLFKIAMFDAAEADKYADIIYGYSVMPMPKLATKGEYPEIKLPGISGRLPAAPGDGAKFGGGQGGDAAGGKGFGGRGGNMPLGGLPGFGANSRLSFPPPTDKARNGKLTSELPPELADQLTGKMNWFSPDGIAGAAPQQQSGEDPNAGQSDAPPPTAGKGGVPPGAKGPAQSAAESRWANRVPPAMPSNPKALIRFVDASVEPGTTYQYRIQVRMANPNYQQPTKLIAHSGLARIKELVSEWMETKAIAVPGDFQFYITNVADKGIVSKHKTAGKGVDTNYSPASIGDRLVPFQVHRFVSALVDMSDKSRRTEYNIGDWLIAERLLVGRGEPIGRECEVDAVKWVESKSKWEFAAGVPIKGKIAARVPVAEFHVQPQVLLLDFVGGHQFYKRPSPKGSETVDDESTYETLLLMPDGTMEVRTSREDVNDEGWNDPVQGNGTVIGQDRRRRFEQWKARIEEVRGASNPNNQKSGGDKGGGGG